MITKLHKLRIAVYAILLPIACLCSFVSNSVAHATSVYDDYYQSVSSIKVNASNFEGTSCSDNDITTTWESYILDKSKWPLPTSYNGADTSFRNALANGRWAVSTYNNYVGSNGYYTGVFVVWTEDDSLTLSWDSNYEGVKATGSGNNVHEMDIAPSVVETGSGCDTKAWGYYTVPFSIISKNKQFILHPGSSSEAGGYANLSVYTNNISTPSDPGFVGSIPTSSKGSIVEPISGSIECFNYDPITQQTGQVTSVHVTPSSGIDGNATISSDGNGTSNYEYYPSLSSNTYTLAINCGGSIMDGGPANSNVSSDIWYCSLASGSDCFLN